MPIVQKITGFRKTYERSISLCVPMSLFLEDPQIKNVLDTNKINTVEHFLKFEIEKLDYVTERIRKGLKDLQTKMWRALARNSPIAIAQKILENRPAKRKITKWALHFIATAKALLQTATRKRQEYIKMTMHSMVNNKWERWVMDVIKTI